MERWFEWRHMRARPDGDEFKETRRYSIQAIECTRCAEDILGPCHLTLHSEHGFFPVAPWPLPNVWIGVSVESQRYADERLPPLLRTPAAVRFVSYEPALGPVDFWPWLGKQCRANIFNHGPIGCSNEAHYAPGIDWLIVGGESGPGARPFDLAWARQTIADCRSADVAVFVKQLGTRPVLSRCAPPHGTGAEDVCDGGPVRLADKKGGNPNESPEDLRVREFPRGTP